ncbi:MBL fold metallo-hydrolase [Fredinandcohnia humi]
MIYYICSTCGVQYEGANEPPENCIICSDERQYVPASGQKWTKLEDFQKGQYTNEIVEIEPNLYSIHTKPQVGIGQRAYLVCTPGGNILWDCITYLDEEIIKTINNLGGIQAIALSHPHYYSTIVEWAEVFDCSIYIHHADKEWVTRSSARYIFWEGENFELNPDLILINTGGHFDGSTVLHWKKGTQSNGSLLVGDTIFIVPDPGWVSFMYSHPNRIPLPAHEVRKIKQILQNYDFDSIYGAFESHIKYGGKEAVMKSADRYLYHLGR